MSNGALAGFPVVDIKATLHDGSYHDVDSSVLAFQVSSGASGQSSGSGYRVRFKGRGLRPRLPVITCAIGQGLCRNY